MVNDRGRLGLLVALCSLAGVAVGFGLSNMAAGVHGHNCHASMAATPTPAAIQVLSSPELETPTWLGVRIQTDSNGGARVIEVEPNSPAMHADIHEGDVILGFAQGCRRPVSAVNTSQDLVRLVQSSKVGTRAIVILDRDGERMRVKAKLEHMPRSVHDNLYNR